ncbi:MAG: circularly permuted type 2 ATP-grasp protein [Gammaproteobacteria bacterium]|nr:circularly permuted type 2 ATP-grasp protein [Gammaproteobacteria bacterium]
MNDKPPQTTWSPPRQLNQSQHQVQGVPAATFHYEQSPGFIDEVYDASGAQRSHWQYLLNSMESLGGEALADRQRKALRILRDDGATYNLSAQPQARRTWGLDPVPLLIDSEEWNGIESGLIERSELLDLVLKDIYGPRDLIRHGVVPPELIFSHAGFLRQCHDIKMPGEHQLILHSVDMVRNAQGQMCVVADRTQAPSGAGYALENRTVMSRVLPSLFRDSHVHRLSMFFQTLRLKLAALCPNSDDIPHVVVLTPGAYSETYFEHALLANYLGYPLVQGSDLTVRGGFVWMKSLDGLKRVDVILRRVDDYYCDAVELRSDSQLGVPGLLNVVRSGRAVVANPLGSGVLENSALLKYLPAIGKFFLGREPQMDSVRSYWCGDDSDRQYVLEHFDELIIKPTFRRVGEHSVFGGELNSEQKATWKTQIVARPLNFVAQDYMRPSNAPSWSNGGLLARPLVLRSFAVANPSAYTIMPGGLTRVGSSDNKMISSSQLQSTSKDTWVLASEPEKQTSLRTDADLAVSESTDQGMHLPSRVAANLFWMGRYAERAEASLRLLRTVFMQLNSVEPLSPIARGTLLNTVTRVSTTYPGFTRADIESVEDIEKELLGVILDENRAGSIVSNLQAMLISSEEVKEMLSADTQRVLNDLRDALADLGNALRPGLASAPEEALDPLVTTLLALAGLNHESMMRGMGWRFLEMGRTLEKSYQMTSLLQSSLVVELDENDQATVLESVLLSFEMLVSYRRRYRSRAEVKSGLQLLMIDQTNPRSLQFQLGALKDHIHGLPEADRAIGLTPEGRCTLEALTAVQLADLAQLVACEEGTYLRARLDQLLNNVQELLETTATLISDKYFDHQTAHQQLVTDRWEDD